MKPTPVDDLDERLESLPWEHVKPVETPGRRWMVAAAGAVVVVAVVASATRTLWPAAPLSAPVTAPSTVDPALPTVNATLPTGLSSDADPTVTTRTAPVTEADLRAIAPGDAARAVGAHAEWFISEWLTVDGRASEAAPALLPDGLDVQIVDASARSFVESAVALSTEEVAPGSWEVAVLVRTLSAFGDDDYVRIPARAFLVTVGLGDEGPFVVDLPTPGPLPQARASAPDLVEAPAPANVITAALATMREAGLPDESTIGTARHEDLWRVTGVVRDEAGVPFVVAVWLDRTGERVPAPG